MSQDMLGVSLRAARGPLNTLMERLAGEEGGLWLKRLNKFNRKENSFDVPEVPLTVDLSFFRPSVTSVISFLETHQHINYKISDEAKAAMLERGFDATEEQKRCGVRLVIMKANKMDWEPTTQMVRKMAAERGYATPPAISAPFLRIRLSDDDLIRHGLDEVFVMHEPILLNGHAPQILSISRETPSKGVTESWLKAEGVYDRTLWPRRSTYGWAFLAPEK